MNLEEVRRSIRKGKIAIRITPHADIERRKDGLEISDLESAVLHGEKVEDYGERALLLSVTQKDKIPVHLVIEYFRGDPVVAIVTCYVPENEHWEKDWKHRKRRHKKGEKK